MKNGQPPPPPPSHPPPTKYVEKETVATKPNRMDAPAFVSSKNTKYNMIMGNDENENETYQINVNSPYRADAVATPPRRSRIKQDLKKMSNVKNWISKNTHILKQHSNININILSEQRNRIQELELKLHDRNDQMKLLEFQHPFIAKDKDHFPDFDHAFENMENMNNVGGEDSNGEEEEDDELLVDPSQNEESFQNLNFSIDTLAHLHGLKDFSTDGKDGEKGLLRQDSIEDVMRNRPSIGKPTILDSGSAIDKLKTPLRVRNHQKKSSPTIQRGESSSNIAQMNLGDDDAPTMATLYEHVQKQQRLEEAGSNNHNNYVIGKDTDTSNMISPIQQNMDDIDTSAVHGRKISLGSSGRPSTDSIESKHRLSIGPRPSFGSEDDDMEIDHFQKMNSSFGSDDGASSTTSNRRVSLNGLELVASDVGSTNSNNTITIGGMDDNVSGHTFADNDDSKNSIKKPNLSDILHSTPTRHNNKYRSSSIKRSLAVPTPGLSPILSSNESDSRGETSFHSNDNNASNDNSLIIDKKISRSLVFEDIDEEDVDHQQQQKTIDKNINSNICNNSSNSSSNSEITLPGGNKSQSTLLFRGDGNKNMLPLSASTPTKNHGLQIKDLLRNNYYSTEKEIELKRRRNTNYILSNSYMNDDRKTNNNRVIETPGLSPILSDGDHRLARRQRSLIMESKSNLSLHTISPLKESPSMLDLSNDDDDLSRSSRSHSNVYNVNNHQSEIIDRNDQFHDAAPSPFKFTSPMKETPSMLHLDSTTSMSSNAEEQFNADSNSSNNNINKSNKYQSSSNFINNSRANNYGTYILEAQRFGITNREAQNEYAKLLSQRGSTHQRVANRRFSFERDCYETSFVPAPSFGNTRLNGTSSFAGGNTGFFRTSRVYNNRTKVYQDPLKSMFETSYNNNDNFRALNIDPTLKKYSTSYWSKKIAGRSPSGLKA
jgi:hypothetical protein